MKDRSVNDFNRGHRYYSHLNKVGKLSSEISESSGLQYLSSTNHIVTHNDGGNPSELFYTTPKGKLLASTDLNNQKNRDWEDLTMDNLGNLYIGDFGNNRNKRKNLRVIKLDTATKKVTEIKLSYPDQLQFPPEKEKMNFDCEAMFWRDDSLYLISKNRGTGSVKMYKIPSVPGNYQAAMVDSISLKGMITAADYNPHSGKLALLGYGYVYIFDISESTNFANQVSVAYYPRLAQSEGITFIQNDLLISNEKGTLFRLNEKK